MLRGYQRLRDEGLVDLRRGRGAVVTSAAASGQAELVECVVELVALARRTGLGEEDVLALVRTAFQGG